MGLFPKFRRQSTEIVESQSPDLPVTTRGPMSRGGMRNLWRGALSTLAGSWGAWGQLKAGDTGRLMADAPTFPVPSEWIIRQHQRAVVARARWISINNDYARGYMRLCRQNIVGHHGIRYQAQAKLANGKLDKNANEAIEKAWLDWGHRRNADVAGQKSWRLIQQAVVNSLVRNGEFMIRVVTGPASKYGRYGFQLQILDPQRCNPQYDVFDMPNGNFIRSGIEFTSAGKPVAYYFQQESESEAWNAYQYAGRSYTRIPAEEIIHDFIPDMEGQKRGLPWLLTALWRLRQLDAYEDAAVVNARAGAAKMGFVEWSDDSPGPDYDADEGELMLDMEAGAIPVLPKGAKVSKFDPGYPAGEFAQFRKEMLRGMSTGGGVLYNELANDLEGVNFSSIRQGTLDVRENWKDLQQWLIEVLCQPVFEQWMQHALLRNLIVKKNGQPLAAEKIAEWSQGAWQGRRWQWIDPRADVDAAQKEKANLVTPPSEMIREKGHDPHHVWAQFAQDIQDMRDAGIPDEFIKASILPEKWQVKVGEPAGGVDDNAGKEANPDKPSGD
jgi:lambda family phage portal protein